MNKENLFIGCQLSPDNEEDIFLSVVLWSAINNEMDTIEKYYDLETSEHPVNFLLFNIFSVLRNCGYWNSFDQRWDYWENRQEIISFYRFATHMYTLLTVAQGPASDSPRDVPNHISK